MLFRSSTHRGRINGVQTFLQNTMYGVVIYFTGVLYDNFSNVWAWVLIFVLGILVSVGCLYLIFADKKTYAKLYE